MAVKTTVGQLMINDVLPPDLQDYSRKLDKKGVKQLFKELAIRHPDKYREIAAKLMKLGQNVSYNEGSSLSLKDLKTSNAKKKVIPILQAEIESITSDRSLSPTERDAKIVEATSKLIGVLDEAVYREKMDEGNRLVDFAESGARGGKSNVNQLLGAGLMVSDNLNRPIPIPITNNFSEGVTPAEVWAAAYGVRKGYVELKSCLAKGTEVLMADGTAKSIESIKRGDLVMGSDTSGNFNPVKVLDHYNNGNRPCYEYNFRIGRSKDCIKLTATEDHNVLATLKQGRTGKQSRWSVYNPTPLPLGKAANHKDPSKNFYVAEHGMGWENAEGYHEPMALLLGLMLGDGCITGRSYTLSCADNYLINDIANYLESLGLGLTEPKHGYGWNLRYNKYNKNRHGTAGGNNFVEYCKKHGYHGKRAWEKALDDDVWSWSLDSVCALLAGLFSADGGVSVNKYKSTSITLNLTSEKLVRQVRHLLLFRLGILTADVKPIPSATKTGNKPQWVLKISHRSSVQRFSQLVHMVGIKRRRLEDSINLTTGSFRNSKTGFKSWTKTYVGNIPTYDLHVDNDDHLFVLASGLIVSNSTPKAGYFGKQLAQAAHKLVVSNSKPLAGTGLPVITDDPENEGAVLARDYGGYKAGTIITPKIIKELKRKNKRILIHSPIASISTGRGIPSVAAGVREYGRLAKPGENVGISAAQAVAEPLSQSSISSKHTAGVVGASGGGSSAETQAGFDVVENMANIPKNYEDKATIVSVDGSVGRIEDAPQGGKYVYVGAEKFFVPPTLEVTVKPGEKLEAGDIISSGLPSPAELVKYKGIGEGRRYFSDTLHKVLNNSGVRTRRRNVELISRALINHIRVGDNGFKGSLPGDLVEYDEFASRYIPRENSTSMKTGRAKNMYLEQPTLHYSVGTRLTPRVIKDLQDMGVNDVMVHKDEPDFEPEMQRAMDTLASDKDWQVRLGGFNLQRNMLDAIHRGATSERHGESYMPALAQGLEFGKHKTKTY
jgi:hypothetical protein